MINLIWGKEGSGKSSLGLTWPKPLFHMELDLGGFDRASWRLPKDTRIKRCEIGEDIKGINWADWDIVTKPYPIPMQLEKMLGAQTVKDGNKVSIRFPRRVIGYRELWEDIIMDYVTACQVSGLKTIMPDSFTQQWKICLAPSTRILYTDLTWRAIGEAKVGDKLIGFSEYIEPTGRRRLRESTIEAVKERVNSAYKILMDNGASVIASREHPWLKVMSERIWDSLSQAWFLKEQWVMTESLRVGDSLRFMCKPWETDTSWEAGYLAGLYDGEGCVDSPKALTLSQKSDPVITSLISALESRGFESKMYDKSSKGGYTIRIHSKDEILRFLGSIRPSRLLPRAAEVWGGRTVNGDNHLATIVGIEPVETTELIDIKTSTATFIAEGLFSHNCHTAHLQDKQEIQISQGMKDTDSKFRERLTPMEFPNDKMRSFLYTSTSFGKQLVITHYPTDVYANKVTDKGVESYATGELTPEGFKHTKELVDIIIWTYSDKNQPRAKIGDKCGLAGMGMSACGLELPYASYEGLMELQEILRG